MKIRQNPDKALARELLLKVRENGGYCPCSLVKNEDTKCPCKAFRRFPLPGTSSVRPPGEARSPRLPPGKVLLPILTEAGPPQRLLPFRRLPRILRRSLPGSRSHPGSETVRSPHKGRIQRHGSGPRIQPLPAPGSCPSLLFLKSFPASDTLHPPHR